MEIEMQMRIALAAAALAVWTGAAAAQSASLLNVSYDPTRELYAEFNKAFVHAYGRETGKKIDIKQSHGGAGAQARAVIEGLQADVVTLALAHDIDMIASKGLIDKNWQARLPNNSSPYTSTIIFLVRKGNPKAIKDWDDLAKPGVSVITPNPKTSGGARWNYLAAWGHALKNGQTPEQAKAFVGSIYRNAPVLDAGARGSTMTFVERGMGDVLVAWENEAHLALKEFGAGKLEIVVPQWSILAEPPVTIVDKVVDKKGTRETADAYLRYWYTPEGQEIAARNFYRPRDAAVADKHEKSFAKLSLFTIEELFGGWAQAQKEHFAEGGVFDQLYKN
jgi:sulfate/thiosulfate transport system substrate-binding protein